MSATQPNPEAGVSDRSAKYRRAGCFRLRNTSQTGGFGAAQTDNEWLILQDAKPTRLRAGTCAEPRL